MWAARPGTFLAVYVHNKGLTRIFRGPHARNTPHQRPLRPKRRPPRPQHPIFSIFHRSGLCFGRCTTPSRNLAATNRGGITPSKPPTRRRHAARRLRMAQNPHRHQRGGHRGTQDQDAAPALAAGPPPDKFRMQFPQDTNRCTLKNRRISTIRFPDLKYTQGNCMRNYYGMGGGGAWPGLETTHRSATQPHWCGGRRRDRRARAGFEARRRTK